MDLGLIIVGFDPGTTVGISAISISSGKAVCYSRRNLKQEDALRKIISLGFPVAVSADKKKTPSKVRELAAKLNLRLITPDNDLSLKEKSELIKEFLKKSEDNVRIRNSHEHDSLAAAVYALKKSQALIRKLQNSFSGLNDEQRKSLVIESFRREVAIGNIRKQILSEDGRASADAVYQRPKVRSPVNARSPAEVKIGNKDDGLLQKISLLEKKNRNLKASNSRLKKKIGKQKAIIQGFTRPAKISLKRENERAIINEKNESLLKDVALLVELLKEGYVYAVVSRGAITYYSSAKSEGAPDENFREEKTELKTLGITILQRKAKKIHPKKNMRGKESEMLNSIIEDYRAVRKVSR